jgi:hypothetical protein
MYRLNTRIARQVGRRAAHTVVPPRGSHMHRNRIQTVVGATATAIAIFRLFPRPCRVAESNAIDPRTWHGFTNPDAERREGSP